MGRVQRDVTPELVLEGRDLEPIDIKDVHSLTAADTQPHHVDRRIRGQLLALQSERLLEKRCRPLNVLRGERQVRELQ